MKKLFISMICAVMCIGASGCSTSAATKFEVAETKATGNDIQFGKPAIGDKVASIETDMGTVEILLFPEYAPKAVENFVTLAEKEYYNGLTFHRIFDEFMIQGGDPKGDGTGGESIWPEGFEYEFAPELHHIRGALAMAHSAAPNSNGSQFYIVQNTKLNDASKEMYQFMLDNQDEPLAKNLMKMVLILAV